MSTDFNVKKEKDMDFDEEIEADSKKDSSNDLKKFIIKLMLIIGGGILLLMLILSLSSPNKKQTYTYEQIEEIMVSAAKSYFTDHPESLPESEKQIVEIATANLTQAGKMRDISEYVEAGTTCTAKVSVSKVGSEYVYTPYLNCGESYSNTALYTKVLEDSPITESGYGLYQLNNEKVFRGEKVNNYVQLEKSLWRIVKIDSGNNIFLIKAEATLMTAPWDDRYNAEFKYNVGINNYSTSRIKEKLDTLYNTTDENIMILSNNDKAKLSSYDVCVGSRALNTKTNSNAVECKKKESNQMLGLLTISDYINASIDPNCETAESPSCQNYNYLVGNYAWWTTTPVTDSSANAYAISVKGTIISSQAINYNRIRPVIKLSSRAMVTDGEGTEENPYIIK